LKVAYRDLWPGIDLAFSGTQGHLKYTFLVKPGADPGEIRMRWSGESAMHVNGRGQLVVSTATRNLLDGQRDDGSWALYHEGPADLSTTIEAYVALRVLGFDAWRLLDPDFVAARRRAIPARAAERLGFTFEGVFEQHMVYKGRSRDTAWYAITDDRWPSVRAGRRSASAAVRRRTRIRAIRPSRSRMLTAARSASAAAAGAG